MRFTLASDHFDYYSNHGYIGFDGLFSPKLLEDVENIVTKNSRDLWRSNLSVKSVVFERTCAEIAAELTRAKQVRLGFDQALCSNDSLPFGKSSSSLADLLCIQPITCGMMLRLTEGNSPLPSTIFCPCPEKRGTALFFSAKMLMTLLPLTELKNQKFLLVGYAGPKPLYVAKETDPAVHSLKNLGYGFGDHLNTTTHPILFSK
ncbi:MAG: hypothetical protein KGZ39_01485 [Simkania sp.]|nr:hypothetical protein [Simkania sp.]